MGKNKQSQKTDGPPQLPSRDLFHRLNYTFQASAFLQNLQIQGSSRDQQCSRILNVTEDHKGKKRAVETKEDDGGEEGDIDLGRLAREAMRSTRKMVVHNQLKVDPGLKRSICKTCNTVLIPGLTCRIRNRPDPIHFHKTHITCLTCLSRKSIPQTPLPESPRHSSIPPGDSGDLPMSSKDDRLDGPVRRCRRERISRKSKPAFHDLEQPSSTSIPTGEQRQPQNQKKTTDEERKNSRKGHTLWTGDQKITNWGTHPS